MAFFMRAFLEGCVELDQFRAAGEGNRSGGSGVRTAFGSHASICAALDEAMPDTVALFPFS